MESHNSEIAHQFFFFRVYKDGRIEKTFPTENCPPSDDSITGIQSKDVTISPHVSVRVFLPKINGPDQKLPLLLYIHGGGFSFESAFSPRYHKHLISLVNESNVVAVSVEYRVAPEAKIPACYEDAWSALQWIASHVNGNGQDPWINTHVDFNNVFIGGDSAGGNITNDLAIRVGKNGLHGVRVNGIILVHPFFAPPGDYNDAMWLYMCGGSKSENYRVQPTKEDLAKIGCDRALVFVAEKDELQLRDRGAWYCEELKNSGWTGTVEFVENFGEGHCFHLQARSTSDNAVALVKRIASFINHK